MFPSMIPPIFHNCVVMVIKLVVWRVGIPEFALIVVKVRIQWLDLEIALCTWGGWWVIIAKKFGRTWKGWMNLGGLWSGTGEVEEGRWGFWFAKDLGKLVVSILAESSHIWIQVGRVCLGVICNYNFSCPHIIKKC